MEQALKVVTIIFILWLIVFVFWAVRQWARYNKTKVYKNVR